MKRNFIKNKFCHQKRFLVSDFRFHKSRGFAAFYVTILVLAVVFAMAVSIFILTYNEQKISQNIIKSTQAYYTAEAGAEDALLRLADSNMSWSSPYVLNLADNSATTTISDIIGGARVITVEGNAQERIRKISVGYKISTQEASFYYGAQIGDGGIIMTATSSEIDGNVFSNGNVIGPGKITETVVVAHNGNKIENLIVGKDAHVHTCKNSTISGTLKFVSGGSLQNCTAGQTEDRGPNEIESRDFPISQSLIQQWQNEAAAGGIITGNLTISGDTTLGPVKIEGNLLVKNAILTMIGTIWVTGTFDNGNNVEIKLDENSYGDLSGVLIVDGNIQIRNNAILEGTSFPSSYLLIISNSSSLSESDAAIDVKNNALGSILFSPNGLMVIHNNVELIEATTYKLLLKNNSKIKYEIGLDNLEFTSGPSGSWEVASWREIE